MKYQSLEQIALLADVHPGIAMSRRERLEHWAELLERQRNRRLSTIEGTEFGSPREREGKRAGSSPLTVAFEDWGCRRLEVTLPLSRSRNRSVPGARA
jgi:hypothetical protein